jgi:uncharacterized protein with GYD domain
MAGENPACSTGLSGTEIGPRPPWLPFSREVHCMANFVTLYRFNGPIKGGGPERYQKFKGLVEEQGGKISFFAGLLGPWDVITVADYPSNRAAMKGSASVANLINARTLTLPCVDEKDFLQLLTEV